MAAAVAQPEHIEGPPLQRPRIEAETVPSAIVCGRAKLCAESRLEELFGADVWLCELLRARRVHTLRDLIYLPSWELRDWLLVPEDDAASIIAQAWRACAGPMTNALDLRKVKLGAPSVALPLTALGSAIGGGLSGAFVEVAGPAGVGKTQLCLHIAALTAAAGGEVFWIDAEGTFAPNRLMELIEDICRKEATGNVEMAEDRSVAALARVRKRACASLQELHEMALELERRTRQGGALPALIVVDSVAAVARCDGNSSESMRVQIPRRQAALNAMAGLFKTVVAGSETSRTGGSSPPGVLITNQVAGDPSSGSARVTLGNVWHHAVNWRLVLSHLSPDANRGLGQKDDPKGPNFNRSSRFLHVEKSPVSGPITIEFTIGRSGLSEVSTVGEAVPEIAVPQMPRGCVVR